MVATETQIEILPIEQIEELYSIADEFISESKEYIPFNKEAFKNNWVNLYAAQAGQILYAHRDGVKIGVLGYLVYNDLLSGEPSAMETFWFVKKEYRGEGIKLLDEFENKSRSMGLSRVVMVHLSKLMPEKVKSIYLKRGYREIETSYVKELI